MIKASLDRLAQVEAIDIQWKSYELRPLNAPPLPPVQEEDYKQRIAAAWPRTRQTAQVNFGVEMIYHRWGVKSRLAHEGAKFAEEKGLGEAYHAAMYKAHFIEDRDFGDLEILADIAEEVGLDRAEFVAAIENHTYAAEVDQDVAQAQAYGIQGVPATVIEGKYMVSGAQPFEALVDIVRQVKEHEAKQTP
ncbi:MAG TPA: DsbA family protein [Anaerolineae bacterium]|nr:DsbA family protein [Anaerolineae bacterium]MCB9102854.1 DsbA family protein [Anaerolineales bacterium]HRV91422.1 DsbA family protein [Anaerolineae bacterium]